MSKRTIIVFVTGALIFVGGPIISWGLGDVPGFFAEPARLTYAIVAAIAQLVIALRMPIAGKNRVEVETHLEQHAWTLQVLQVLPMMILIVGPLCDRRGWLTLGQGVATRWLGLVLFAGGFAFMHWAESVLGEYFTVDVALLENHKLVTTGPYRWIRHPRYLGIALFALGMALVFHAWLAIGLALLVMAALLYRCHAEDAMLHEAFGIEWEAWAAKSWRLIPWVW